VGEVIHTSITLFSCLLKYHLQADICLIYLLVLFLSFNLTKSYPAVGPRKHLLKAVVGKHSAKMVQIRTFDLLSALFIQCSVPKMPPYANKSATQLLYQFVAMSIITLPIGTHMRSIADICLYAIVSVQMNTEEKWIHFFNA
jgi:hypothetical protein